jgi:hypothetical protein
VGRHEYLSNKRHDSAWLKAGRSVSQILQHVTQKYQETQVRQIVSGPDPKTRMLQFKETGYKLKRKTGEESVCILQYCYRKPACAKLQFILYSIVYTGKSPDT